MKQKIIWNIYDSEKEIKSNYPNQIIPRGTRYGEAVPVRKR